MTGRIQDHYLLGILWDTWDIYEWDLVFHVVSWVSSWVVFGLFFVGFWLLCFVFVLFWRHLAFCSPILQHEGIPNERQNVLMTVRASSAHGKKKNTHWATITPTSQPPPRGGTNRRSHWNTSQYTRWYPYGLNSACPNRRRYLWLPPASWIWPWHGNSESICNRGFSTLNRAIDNPPPILLDIILRPRRLVRFSSLVLPGPRP